MAKLSLDNIFQAIADKINGTSKSNNSNATSKEKTLDSQQEPTNSVTSKNESANQQVKPVEQIEKVSPEPAKGLVNEPIVVSHKQQQPHDAIKKRSELVKSIVDTLAENFKGFSTKSFEDKALVIWINNNIFYNSIDGNTDFQNQVVRTIYDELGFGFDNLTFCPGPIHEGEIVTPLVHDAFMQLVPKKQVGILRKAQLKIVEGNGSTIEPFYVLDSTAIKGLPQERYNIGIGKSPLIGPNVKRENQIAIDDNPNSPSFDKNKYVSRSHANITFDENHGFMLKAEVGGTPAGGKRTYIQRGKDTIKLENTITTVPLKHGDTIILTKNVYLEFKEL